MAISPDEARSQVEWPERSWVPALMDAVDVIEERIDSTIASGAAATGEDLEHQERSVVNVSVGTLLNELEQETGGGEWPDWARATVIEELAYRYRGAGWERFSLEWDDAMAFLWFPRHHLREWDF